MRGRYAVTSPADILRRQLGFIEHPNLAPRYNLAPTRDAPVVRQRRVPRGERTLAMLRWGFVAAWAKDPKAGPPLVDARAETLLERLTFSGASA